MSENRYRFDEQINQATTTHADWHGWEKGRICICRLHNKSVDISNMSIRVLPNIIRLKVYWAEARFVLLACDFCCHNCNLL